MSEVTSAEQHHTENEQDSVTSFGYELVREDLLRDILGKDAPEILYWAGKRLARKYPLSSLEEIIRFFQQACWGTLSVKEESRKQLILELGSDLISMRLKNHADSTFQLEAGFLAQQIEFQKKVSAEAFEHPAKRASRIQFTIKWDSRDSVG